MYCRKCGNLLQPTDAFCNKCGEPVGTVEPQQIVPEVVNNIEEKNEEQVASNESMMKNIAEPQVEQSNEATTIIPVDSPVPETEPVLNPNSVGTSIPTSEPLQQPTQTNEVTENVQQAVQETPKSNKLFIIIVIALLAIIVIMGGILLYKKVFSNNTNSNTNTASNQNVNNDINNINNNNNNNTNSNTFEYKNYLLPIPTNYTASLDENNFLSLINRTDRIADLTTMMMGYTMEDVNESIEAIKLEIIKEGAQIISTENKTIGEKDWTIINFNMEKEGITYNGCMAFTYMGRFVVSENVIYNMGNLSQEQILTDFSTMYKNTTYNGTKEFSKDDKPEEVSIIPLSEVDFSSLD